METNDNGIWFDDLIFDKLTDTERLWREIFRIADEYRLMIRFHRHYLLSKRRQYTITVYKLKNGEEESIISVEAMELAPLLREVKQALNQYRNKHKDYLIQKPGIGELI